MRTARPSASDARLVGVVLGLLASLVLAGCELFTRPVAPTEPATALGAPTATAPATASAPVAPAHAPVEEVALRLMRAAAACDRTAALADVGNAEDAHELMTRELDRTAVDEDTARFLDKQCKRLGGSHHGQILEARLEGSRHMSARTEHILVRDVDILAVTVTVRVDGAKAPERVTLHFFETSRGFRFTPRP
jgi:hypothetical protein